MPSFSLADQAGEQVTNDQLLGTGPVVVYFYPKDNTPVCTAEACAFRDQYDVFREAGAQVVGISADNEQSHQSFAAKHSLPFQLLSDPDSNVARQFGVKKSFGLLPGRVTFVFDADGVLRHQFSSQLLAAKHVAESLQVIKKLCQTT